MVLKGGESGTNKDKGGRMRGKRGRGRSYQLLRGRREWLRV
jgi:hypothetical protein